MSPYAPLGEFLWTVCQGLELLDHRVYILLIWLSSPKWLFIFTSISKQSRKPLGRRQWGSQGRENYLKPAVAFEKWWPWPWGHLRGLAPFSPASAPNPFQIRCFCWKAGSWFLPTIFVSYLDSLLYHAYLPLLLSLFELLPSHPKHPSKSRSNHRFSRLPFLCSSLLPCFYLHSSPGKKGETFWQVPKGGWMELEHEMEGSLFSSEGWLSSNTALKLPFLQRSPQSAGLTGQGSLHQPQYHGLRKYKTLQFPTSSSPHPTSSAPAIPSRTSWALLSGLQALDTAEPSGWFFSPHNLANPYSSLQTAQQHLLSVGYSLTPSLRHRKVGILATHKKYSWNREHNRG